MIPQVRAPRMRLRILRPKPTKPGVIAPRLKKRRFLNDVAPENPWHLQPPIRPCQAPIARAVPFRSRQLKVRTVMLQGRA